MAKKGMKRPQRTHTEKRNDAPPVPEIQGKAKSGKNQANPIIVDTNGPNQKVFHTKPYKKEKTISDAYQAIDTDLARDNLENDIPFADLQDNWKIILSFKNWLFKPTENDRVILMIAKP